MNILLVEDDEAVADILMEVLKTWDQKVVWVSTKKEAVSQIEDSRFDIILLDIMLPDGFGYEIIPEIKRSQPGMHILTMTGHNTPEFERTIRGFGITYYMSKPVNVGELKQIIDHIENKQNKEVA